MKTGDICKHCGVGTLFASGQKALSRGKRNCRKKTCISDNTFFHAAKFPVNQILHIGYDGSLAPTGPSALLRKRKL
jgi:hypothetical protein